MFVDDDMAEIALKLTAAYGLCNRPQHIITEARHLGYKQIEG